MSFPAGIRALSLNKTFASHDNSLSVHPKASCFIGLFAWDILRDLLFLKLQILIKLPSASNFSDSKTGVRGCPVPKIFFPLSNFLLIEQFDSIDYREWKWPMILTPDMPSSYLKTSRHEKVIGRALGVM